MDADERAEIIAEEIGDAAEKAGLMPYGVASRLIAKAIRDAERDARREVQEAFSHTMHTWFHERHHQEYMSRNEVWNLIVGLCGDDEGDTDAER